MAGAQSVTAQGTRYVNVTDVPPAKSGTIHADTLWRVGNRNDDPPELGFSIVSDIELDSLGHLLVVDSRKSRVCVLTQSGGYVATLGHGSPAVGGLSLPIAVSVAPDSDIFVYDAGSANVVEFNKNYAFVRTIRTSKVIGNVRSFVVSRDRIYVSGVGQDPDLRGHTVHTFARATGTYLFSFGLLAPTSTEDVSYLVGAGRITRARDGGLWYAQVAPYVVRKYSPDGRLLVEIDRANAFLTSGDSAYAILLQGGRMITSPRPHAAAFRAQELADGSLIHQTRLADGRIVTDFYSPQYTLTASTLGIPGLSLQFGPGLFAALLYDNEVPSVGAVRIDTPH